MVTGIGGEGFIPHTQAAASLSYRHRTEPEQFAKALEQHVSSKANRASKADPAPAKENAELRAAVQEVEAYFLKEMLTSMRKTIPKGGLFDKSFATETYEAMQDEHLAKEMAEAGGIGLGDLLYRQLSEETW